MSGGHSLPTVGAEQSDLVEWYRLETKFLPDHVRHTKHLEDSRSRREEEWSNCGVLGEGGFSVVHKQLESSTGNCRAVKVIDKTKQVNYSRELLVMAVLAKHPSLFVKFLGWFEECDTLYIAMEYLEMGDLRKNITGPLPHETVRRITKQLLEGLAVMHQKGIAHRDLKLENIFVVSMDPVWVKLGDFGISKRIHKDTTLHTQVATRIYAAPEVLEVDSAIETSEYTNAVDIWSLGCVIYELLTGEMLFSTESQIFTYYFSKSSFPKHKLETLSPAINDPEISLIKSMVSAQPNDRPSVPDLLGHTWMADLRSETDDENNWEDQNELSQTKTSSTQSSLPKTNPRSIESQTRAYPPDSIGLDGRAHTVESHSGTSLKNAKPAPNLFKNLPEPPQLFFKSSVDVTERETAEATYRSSSHSLTESMDHPQHRPYPKLDSTQNETGGSRRRPSWSYWLYLKFGSTQNKTEGRQRRPSWSSSLSSESSGKPRDSTRREPSELSTDGPDRWASLTHSRIHKRTPRSGTGGREAIVVNLSKPISRPSWRTPVLFRKSLIRPTTSSIPTRLSSPNPPRKSSSSSISSMDTWITQSAGSSEASASEKEKMKNEGKKKDQSIWPVFGEAFTGDVAKEGDERLANHGDDGLLTLELCFSHH